MENPIKIDDLGGKTHYFRKHPYRVQRVGKTFRKEFWYFGGINLHTAIAYHELRFSFNSIFSHQTDVKHRSSKVSPWLSHLTECKYIYIYINTIDSKNLLIGLWSYSLGIQPYSQMMIGMSNHLLSIVFRFHYHYQEVIESLGILFMAYLPKFFQIPPEKVLFQHGPGSLAFAKNSKVVQTQKTNMAMENPP